MAPVVFVLGNPRSGASAVRDALLGSAGFAVGSGDGLTAALLEFGRPDRRTGSENAAPSESDENMAERRREFALRLRRAFAPSGSTPQLIRAHGVPALRCLPLLVQAFPEAKFIYMHRRLNETLASYSRSAPGIALPAIAETWSDCEEAWNTHREFAGSRALEIDQRELFFHPFRTADRLRLFLGFDGETARNIAVDLARPRRNASGGAYHIRWSDLALSESDAAQIRKASARAMSAYGYGYDENYRATDDLAITRPGTADLSGLKMEGDSILLELPAQQSETRGQIAIGRVQAGDRISTAVICEGRHHGRLFLRMRLTHRDIALDTKVFDIAAMAGGEIDILLPSVENLILEVSLVATRTSAKDTAIRLHALRTVRSQKRVPATGAAAA